MPITTKPKKSNRPQALNQARNTGPRDIKKAIKTINSKAITQVSNRCSAANPGIDQRQFLAKRISNAADMDASETINNMPSRGGSDQMGRLVTASSTPV